MSPRFRLLLMPGLLLGLACGCGKPADGKAAIRNEGSDTMVNVAQAWAEQYHQEHPDIRVQVLGGGSGVGIASLIDGNCDMANASRKMKKDEIRGRPRNHQGEPKEIIVGYDALAIYVHKETPWTRSRSRSWPRSTARRETRPSGRSLGVPEGTLGNDKIIRVNRQSSSGTYVYFREAVLGKARTTSLAFDRCQRLEGRRGPGRPHPVSHRL